MYPLFIKIPILFYNEEASKLLELDLEANLSDTEEVEISLNVNKILYLRDVEEDGNTFIHCGMTTLVSTKSSKEIEELINIEIEKDL